MPRIGRSAARARARRRGGRRQGRALLEAVDFRVDAAEVDAADLVSAVVEAWRGVWEPAGVAVRAGVSGPLIVSADARRLRQLLDGLVENALRAAHRGAPVVLAKREEDGAVVLEVRRRWPWAQRRGPCPRFDRGVLGDRYAGERKVGIGLGLSIASRLAARLGGRLSAGRASGGGAAFSLRLPCA